MDIIFDKITRVNTIQWLTIERSIFSIARMTMGLVPVPPSSIPMVFPHFRVGIFLTFIENHYTAFDQCRSVNRKTCKGFTLSWNGEIFLTFFLHSLYSKICSLKLSSRRRSPLPSDRLLCCEKPQFRSSPRFGEDLFNPKYVHKYPHHQDQEDHPLWVGFFVVMSYYQQNYPLIPERIFYGKNLWERISIGGIWEAIKKLHFNFYLFLLCILTTYSLRPFDHFPCLATSSMVPHIFLILLSHTMKICQYEIYEPWANTMLNCSESLVKLGESEDISMIGVINSRALISMMNDGYFILVWTLWHKKWLISIILLTVLYLKSDMNLGLEIMVDISSCSTPTLGRIFIPFLDTWIAIVYENNRDFFLLEKNLADSELQNKMEIGFHTSIFKYLLGLIWKNGSSNDTAHSKICEICSISVRIHDFS